MSVSRPSRWLHNLGPRSTQTRWLLVVLAATAVVYLVGFTNLGRSETIRIHYRLLGHHPGEPPPSFILPQFAFDDDYELTRVRVVAIEAGQRRATYWELVGDTASSPLGQLVYGATIPGMRPVSERGAATLVRGRQYELLIESRQGHGRLRFAIP